ncbi:hypothetical protein VSR01_01355 [Actinacidiphila sp. DG2A-62]|uniref:hypothetical protein n=1 Tax=Actinacidiphila sp. DG2A-62 TaxID=3108821 RepID=UPI002DB609D4|nr:hypothetical protein [Actinacidiphila sp. DG2A-62]MEC3992262.1 hypothetical protein [Actinacidiphila sp. DG2A-62]
MTNNPAPRPGLAAAVQARITAEQQQRATAVQHARTVLAPHKAARPAGQPQES